jgi:hypothetical protein
MIASGILRGGCTVILRVVTAVLLVLSAAVVPVRAQRAGDWTENDLDLWGVKPEDVATDAGYWYWKLIYNHRDSPYRPPDHGPITNFPGTLHLPPRSTSLLRGLPFGTASTQPDRDTGQPSYTVLLGKPGSDASATFHGTLGHDAVSEWAAIRRVDGLFRDCPTTATYCAPRNAHAEDGNPPESEVFFGLAVAGRRAVVTHGICCDGESWRVVWFDSESDTSYRFDLELAAANRVGAQGTNPAHVVHAQQLVEIAASFVPVKIPRVPLAPLQVAEAMRSCLPIQEIRVDPSIPAPEQRRVYVEGGPEQLFLVEFADVGGPASVTAEHYRHHLDPRVALIFVHYPGGMEPPAPWAEIRAFHERVRACFLASPS